MAHRPTEPALWASPGEDLLARSTFWWN